MKRSEFRYLERLRVRWSEVDMQKIVFNGHYLMYFDTSVAGYWRALALPYHETMAQLQGDLFVRKATLEYLGSARYDEQLEVGIRCARIGTSSMGYSAAVFRGDQCLVHGELVYVFADPKSQTSKPVPQPLRNWVLGYEAGQAMFEVRVGRWAEMAAAIRPLREMVFVEELGAPPDMIEDAADAGAIHAVAINRLGLPLACGRLLVEADGVGRVGQVGRLGSVAAMRGVGIGRAVLDALLDAARKRGDRQAMLKAQTRAVAFYERAGFARAGEVFEEGGMPHVEMRRSL